MAEIDQLDRLKAQLLTSGLSQQNQALFQVIDQLINVLRKSINTTTGTLSGTSGSGGLTGATYLTEGIETPSLPNSRQVIAGQNIQFQDTPAGRRVIHAIVPHVLDGEDGAEGPQGIQGIQGPQGLIGPMGPPGMDAEYECNAEMPFIGNSIHNGNTTFGEFKQVI